MANLYLMSGSDKARATAIPPRSPPQIKIGTAPLVKVSQCDNMVIGIVTLNALQKASLEWPGVQTTNFRYSQRQLVPQDRLTGTGPN